LARWEYQRVVVQKMRTGKVIGPRTLWTMRIPYLKDTHGWNEILSYWGDAGWELVTVTDAGQDTYTLFFKRPATTEVTGGKPPDAGC